MTTMIYFLAGRIRGDKIQLGLAVLYVVIWLLLSVKVLSKKMSGKSKVTSTTIKSNKCLPANKSYIAVIASNTHINSMYQNLSLTAKRQKWYLAVIKKEWTLK